MAKPLLGELLIDQEIITAEQLNVSLEIQKKEGGLIGIILINEGYITEEILVQYLAMQAEKVVKSDG